MTIHVIEQTTSQRNDETKALFTAIKPYLDQGYTYMAACIQIGHINEQTAHSSYVKGWFKDLKRYGKKQGYDYKDYSGKGRK